MADCEGGEKSARWTGKVTTSSGSDDVRGIKGSNTASTFGCVPIDERAPADVLS